MRAAGHHGRTEMVRAGDDVRDDLGVGRIRHGGFQHADDGGRPRAKADGLANHGRVAVQGAAPEAMRQHRGASRIGPIVTGGQQAAENGPQPHDVEERAADDAGLHKARVAQPGQGEVNRREITEGADRRDARLQVGDLRN